MLTWHWRNVSLKPHIPTIQIFVYTPDGTRRVGMAAVEPEEYRACEDRCDVQMGDSFCRQEDGSYRVKMHAKGVGAELVFRSALTGFKLLSGFVYRSSLAEHGDTITVPRGLVEDGLYLDGQVVPVEGWKYHAHNWGSVNMYECFGGWYWGRLFDPDYTLIYAWLLPLEEAKPNPPFST